MKTVKHTLFSAAALVALSGLAFGADFSGSMILANGGNHSRVDNGVGASPGGSTEDSNTSRGSGAGTKTDKKGDCNKKGASGSGAGGYTDGQNGYGTDNGSATRGYSAPWRPGRAGKEPQEI